MEQVVSHAPYIIGAYGVTCAGLIVLVVVSFVRLRHWAKRARSEEAR